MRRPPAPNGPSPKNVLSPLARGDEDRTRQGFAIAKVERRRRGGKWQKRGTPFLLSTLAAARIPQGAQLGATSPPRLRDIPVPTTSCFGGRTAVTGDERTSGPSPKNVLSPLARGDEDRTRQGFAIAKVERRRRGGKWQKRGTPFLLSTLAAARIPQGAQLGATSPPRLRDIPVPTTSCFGGRTAVTGDEIQPSPTQIKSGRAEMLSAEMLSSSVAVNGRNGGDITPTISTLGYL